MPFPTKFMLKSGFWPQFSPLMPLKQGKFWWYIKSCHLHISPTFHVTFYLKITFILGFIGRWARFYSFWPPFCPLMPLKHGKFGWYYDTIDRYISPIVSFLQNENSFIFCKVMRVYESLCPFCACVYCLCVFPILCVLSLIQFQIHYL